MVAHGIHQQLRLFPRLAFADQVVQVGAVKAGNVFVGVAQLELRQNVVPHGAGSARRKCCDRVVGKLCVQAIQLPVFGTELVSPFRDAMGFVYGKERDGHVEQPAQRFAARQTFRRQIKQPVGAVARLPHHVRLLLVIERTIEHGRGDSHLG